MGTIRFYRLSCKSQNCPTPRCVLQSKCDKQCKKKSCKRTFHFDWHLMLFSSLKQLTTSHIKATTENTVARDFEIELHFSSVSSIHLPLFETAIKTRSSPRWVSVSNVMPRIGIEKVRTVIFCKLHFYVSFWDFACHNAYHNGTLWQAVFTWKSLKISVLSSASVRVRDDFRDRLCQNYSRNRNYAHNYAYTIDDSLSLVLRATLTIQYVIRLLFVLTARSKVHWKRYCYSITPMLTM